MKKLVTLALAAMLLNTTSIYSLEVQDESIIRQMIHNMAGAWNNHEGHGFAENYADNADFVNIFGMTFSGKDEIEIRHVRILETFLKGSKLEVVDVKLREATPDTVIAQVCWKVEIPGKEGLKGVFTHVMIRNNDTWEITASQNTLISK